MAVQLITQAAYARRRNVTPAAVRKAVIDGRITIIERNGKPMIDPDVADVQWQRNTRPLYGSQPPPAPEVPAPSASQDSPFDLTLARARREHHEANLAAMREAEKAGSLVDRAAAIKAVTDAASLLAQSLERLPGLAIELAVESDANKIRARIAEAVRHALDDAIAGMRRLLGEDADGRS